MFAGIIPEERLQLIPTEHWTTHELCFFVHDQMGYFLKRLEETHVNQVEFNLKNDLEQEAVSQTDDVLRWLAENGYDDFAKQIVLEETKRALFADALHFIYEGLIALEKRKFTVAFALFRKPLKETLPIAAWLLSDADGFYRHMSQVDGNRLNSTLSAEKRSQVLNDAVKLLGEDTWLSAELIDTAIFDRTAKGGFAGTFDKATHLTTSHKKYATEPRNLNFIFLDPYSNDLFDRFYQALAHSLIFLLRVQVALYSENSPLSAATEQWMKDVVSAVYHSIFVRGRSPYVRWVNAECADLLRCMSCGHQNRLKKTDVPRLYLAENFECSQCEFLNQFPVFWIMHQHDDDEDVDY